METGYIEIKKCSKFYFFAKRIFDIFFSFLGILIFSPLLILSFILVLCSSKGNVIFKDKRIGKGGKNISVYKFRSMFIDAESNIEKYLTKEQIEKWNKERKLDKDPRLTKVGRLLRKTSIDELPQLFNILGGSMSFIGPRPITEKELKTNFEESEIKVYTLAKPGLISEWGVNGRNNVSYDNHNRQNLELSYYKKRSLLYDSALLFKAVPAVLLEKGAK